MKIIDLLKNDDGLLAVTGKHTKLFIFDDQYIVLRRKVILSLSSPYSVELYCGKNEDQAVEQFIISEKL